jgi:mannose-6-phosphate isomerase-like protein (cupin superfamily)
MLATADPGLVVAPLARWKVADRWGAKQTDPDRSERPADRGGSTMERATLDARDDEQTTAWWFLDALVVEHRVAPQMSGVVLEMTLPVGHSPALHVHEALDDTWYAIEGRMAARCGDEEFVIEAGDWVSMPRGVAHTFRVIGPALPGDGRARPGRRQP